MIHLPRPAAAKAQRSTIAQLVRLLDDRTIDELLRRGEHPHVDAWLGGGTGGGNTTAKPVEGVVVRDAGGRILPDDTGTPDTWQTQDDPVHVAIAELFAELAEAAGLVKRIDQRRQWLLHLHETARKRVNTVELCAGCNDQILPPQRVKRLDGQPYHHPDPVDGEPQPQCWWDAYRSTRRATAG